MARKKNTHTQKTKIELKSNDSEENSVKIKRDKIGPRERKKNKSNNQQQNPIVVHCPTRQIREKKRKKKKTKTKKTRRTETENKEEIV